MVENLLSVTRINDTVTHQVNKTPEIVEEVVSEAVQRLKKRFPSARRKIEINPADPKYIFTEVGVGYRMSEEH